MSRSPVIAAPSRSAAPLRRATPVRRSPARRSGAHQQLDLLHAARALDRQAVIDLMLSVRLLKTSLAMVRDGDGPSPAESA